MLVRAAAPSARPATAPLARRAVAASAVRSALAPRAARAPARLLSLARLSAHGRAGVALLPRRAHSSRSAAPGARAALPSEQVLHAGFGPLALLAAVGLTAVVALSQDEAEAAEKKGQKAAANDEEDRAEDVMELLNVRDFSLEQARSWMNNYATSPQPEAILSGLRPLLRDLFKALEEAEKASDAAPPDELQFRMMHLIGFIGGTVHRHPAQVLPRLEALMLTQNDLSEQPGLLLGVLMPALIMAGTKEGGGLAMQVYGLMREMESEFNKTAKPEPKKVVAEFQKMAQNMVRNMFPVLPMICLGRWAGTGDGKVLEQAYSSLNKLLTEINNEKQANAKMPPEAEAAAASLKNVCAVAFREFAKSSPAAAKALADYPVAKDKYPLAHALVRGALDGKEQPKIKAPAKK